MASKPKRLGKGLGALMKSPVVVESAVSDAGTATDVPRGTSMPTQPDRPHQPAPPPARDTPDQEQHERAPGERVAQIPVDAIVPNPSQPRGVFDEEALKTLSDSVAEHGILQPILVRKMSGIDRWELVAGERRWRAAKLAGLQTVPALVRGLSDRDSAEIALIENLQREDLNVVERAIAIRELCSRFNLTHAQVSERVGLDRSSVTNLIRLLELDQTVLAHLSTGRLSMGHGRALLAEPKPERRERLAALAVEEQWSVRELERRVKAGDASGGASMPKSQPKAVSPAIADLERRVGDQLGTKVTIKTDRTGKKGTLTLTFYGLEHFESVLNRMGVADQAV